MEAMRQNWTDDRMDDLARQVDAGFSQARVDLGSMRAELHREIKEQGKELRREMKSLGSELRGEMKSQAQGSELREGIRGQTREVRVEIQALRRQMDARFDALHAILAANQRTMLQICGGLCVALIAAVATLISTIV